MATLFTGGSVFDGHRHLPGHALLVDDGKVVAVLDLGSSVERSRDHAGSLPSWTLSSRHTWRSWDSKSCHSRTRR